MPKRVWQRSKDRKDCEKGQLTAELCSLLLKVWLMRRERSESSRRDSFCEGGFWICQIWKSLDTFSLALHWGHWSWADFWSSWQQLNLSGYLYIDTDSNSEFMNASTGIGTNIQTKIRRAFRAAKAMVATIVKLAFFRRHIHIYVRAWNAYA